jgi:hypothetical protein
MKFVNRRLIQNIFFLTILSTTSCNGVRSIEPHTWQAQPVLISLFTATNNTRRADYEWSKLPDLVLYADGRIILTRDDAKRIIYEAHLQPTEVCSLLQQIAGDGFLNMQPGDYDAIKGSDFDTIWINIDAWQSNKISSYGLDSILRDNSQALFVSPALKATYLRLRDYTPANLQEFHPEKLVVSILSLGQQETASDWPLQKPTLANLISREQNYLTGVILDKGEAIDVYRLFSGNIYNMYNENGKSYRITIRPLLPFEIWEADRKWTLPPKFQPAPTTELKCPAG